MHGSSRSLAGHGVVTGDPSLADYLAVLRRRWLWVSLPLVVALVGSVVWTTTRPASYRATSTVLVRASAAEDAVRGQNGNTGLLTRDLANEINYATSDEIEAEIEARLGSVPDIAVSARSDADLLEFTATAAAAEEAAQIANTWAEVYVDEKQAEALSSITSASEQLAQRLADLQAQRVELLQPVTALEDQLLTAQDEQQRTVLQGRIDRLLFQLGPQLDLLTVQQEAVAGTIATLDLQGELAEAGTARVVERAVAPESPANAPLSRTVAVGLILGGLLGAAAALLRENLDRVVRSAADVERLTALPVLASVPRQSRRQRKGTELGLATLTDPTSALADSYHKVRSALQFANTTAELRSILVTSPNQGEGKTVTSANLGWALTKAWGRVVLLDGDFRRPRVHEVYGVGNQDGFTDHITQRRRLIDVTVAVESDGARMAVVPTGPLPPNPADFITSGEYERALKLVIQDSDLTVIDGPPVLPVSDVLTLARSVDAVVLVVHAGRTTGEELLAALESLRQVGATVLGVVLLRVKARQTYNRYGYYGNKDEGRSTAPQVRIIAPSPGGARGDHSVPTSVQARSA